MSVWRHVADMSADTTLSPQNCRHRHSTCATKIAPRMIGTSVVLLKYSMRWHSLVQSCMSEPCTQVVRKAIATAMLGQTCLATYSALATTLWNATSCFSGSCGESSSAVIRFKGMAIWLPAFDFESVWLNFVRCFVPSHNYVLNIVDHQDHSHSLGAEINGHS